MISPILLVRFLTIEQFGLYREFLLYAGILCSFSALNVNVSLLYFVPARPASAWRYVWQCTLMVAVSSVVLIAAVYVVNRVMGGALVAGYALPLALYVLFFVNLDFWESLWVAQKKSLAVLQYSVLRLAIRLIVVVLAAALTSDVTTIIWALVVLEGLRFIGSAVACLAARESIGPSLRRSWRDHLRSVVPLGLSLVLTTLTRNVGNTFIVRLLGPVALAQYTIGTYVAPIVIALRNSVSDALLPEMASGDATAEGRTMSLWRQSTVLFAVLLLPIAALLARFAELIITTLFSAKYLESVLIFQIYTLLLLRECFDFGVLVRAFNQNSMLAVANGISLLLNVLLLLLLMPPFGMVGAVCALLIARILDGLFLLWSVSRYASIAMTQILPWGRLGRVLAATIVSAIVLIPPFWTSTPGLLGKLAGAAAGAALFFAIYVLALRVSGVPEAGQFGRRLLSYAGSLRGRKS